jgi:hypothetical protein
VLRATVYARRDGRARARASAATRRAAGNDARIGEQAHVERLALTIASMPPQQRLQQLQMT